MATEDDLRTFKDRQRTLLAKERDAEVARSSLLLSNCGPNLKLLEQKGLSVGGLGVSLKIGLAYDQQPLRTIIPYPNLDSSPRSLKLISSLDFFIFGFLKRAAG